jgi:hypothetical protein
MKIGFAVHFFDFRNDVRETIRLVGRTHEVVLFVRKADEHIIREHAENAEIRIVDENSGGWRSKLWDNLFRFFGKLPKSRHNFYLMEYFKISLTNKEDTRRKAYRLLNLSMKLPRVFSYDAYLNRLSLKENTPIDDIDQFVCFTDISDSYFFARLLRHKKNVKVYVYSWDHPCKHVKYSRKARYLVWHEGLRQDLVDLQGLPASNINVVGSSQFGYVHRFVSRTPNPNLYPFRYLYFGCAIGIPALTVKEVEVIKQVSRWMTEADSTLKLVVRPYPVLTNWSYYEELTKLPNVVLDDQFRKQDLSIDDEQIDEKYRKIHNAEAFVHLGTTMGLEACFTGTPSLLLDLPEFKTGDVLCLYNFVHQFQNEKYLMNTREPNVVSSAADFKRILLQLERDKASLLNYNRAVTKQIDLKSFEQFAIDIVSA